MSLGALPVAEKPKRPKKPAEPKGNLYGPSKPIIIQMRGSLPFKEWARNLAKHDRSLLPDMIERLLVNHARQVGFNEPPPPR